MSDVLIRDIPGTCWPPWTRAASPRWSRTEHIRRRLAADAASSRVPVSVADLRGFAVGHVDLADPGHGRREAVSARGD